MKDWKDWTKAVDNYRERGKQWFKAEKAWKADPDNDEKRKVACIALEAYDDALGEAIDEVEKEFDGLMDRREARDYVLRKRRG